MIVVIPICNKDGELAIKNLEWQRDLGRVDWDCLVSVDDSTPQGLQDRAMAVAKDVYRNVEWMRYPSPETTGWPQAPNQAWQAAANYIASWHKRFKDQSWLFLEPDAIPIRKDWAKDIEVEYLKCKKPFMGYIVSGMGHLTGVAVYPPMVSRFVTEALLTQNVAWDVVLGKELRGERMQTLVHNAPHLFYHVWALDENRKPTNATGKLASFSCKEEVFNTVDLNAAIFHRNKDGTLIDQLRFLRSKEYNVPDHTGTTHVVPSERKVEASVVEPEIKYMGRAEILIVTYHKDAPWLDYSLRLMRKYLKGFSGITLVVPDRDAEVFRQMVLPYPEVNMQTWPEVKGKGMLDHMVQICRADHWCPRADIVVHLDPDCMFHTPTTVDEYVVNRKPVLLHRSYAKLLQDKSDCYQWKKITEDALGFETDVYTMCRHPSCHPVRIYKKLREWIEHTHGKSFEEYVLSGRNEFPQSFAEFPTLGAFAWENMKTKYHWINVDKEKAPVDKQMTFWSHAGLTAENRSKIESFLKQ